LKPLRSSSELRIFHGWLATSRRFELQAGLSKAGAELNQLQELRIVQRIDVMQLAERWVSKQNGMRQE
jgi:hypothetical protein